MVGVVLGRVLKSEESVDHCDGIKSNSVVSNLIVRTEGENSKKRNVNRVTCNDSPGKIFCLEDFHLAADATGGSDTRLISACFTGYREDKLSSSIIRKWHDGYVPCDFSFFVELLLRFSSNPNQNGVSKCSIPHRSIEIPTSAIITLAHPNI
jgi:hypothetical protein